jgi:hypothetical protein
MPEPELSLLFVRPLNQFGVRYLVSGSVAAILYGEPRLTHDVGFVVLLRSEQAGRLHHMFPAADFYAPPSEIVLTELAREHRGHFNVIHLDTGFNSSRPAR